MRLSQKKLKEVCDSRGLGLTEALAKAGVSRTAYYSLTRKDSVVPSSLVALAGYLKVPVFDLLFDEALELRQHQLLLTEVDNIVSRNKISERDNVRHTLISLQRLPIERLATALRGARV